MSRSDDDRFGDGGRGAGVLARHPYLDTDDAQMAQARISALLIPHQLEVHRGLLPFRAVHRHAALEALSFHYLACEPEVTMTWTPPGRFHLLTIPISGLLRVARERRRIEIAPGQCLVFDPTAGSRLDLIGNAETLFVKIPSTGTRFRSVEFRGPVAGEGCAGLIDLVRWVCRDLDHAAPLSADAAVGARIEGLVVDAVLSAWRHDGTETARRAPAPRNVRRCEEFVELHAGEPITIADMTAVSGASARALFQAFRDHRRTSPMAYLKSHRLERAHAALAVADGEHLGVGRIAAAWSFGHGGDFARDYRARFGCNPSDTLRRAPDLGYPGASDTNGGG